MTQGDMPTFSFLRGSNQINRTTSLTTFVEAEVESLSVIIALLVPYFRRFLPLGTLMLCAWCLHSSLDLRESKASGHAGLKALELLAFPLHEARSGRRRRWRKH